MQEAAARARLERMVASNVSPLLTRGEVDDLLAIGARPDVDGRLVDDPDWDNTYDLNAAAAEGWRWKAAKAAADPDFSADGVSVSASKVADNCTKMAERYDTASSGTGGLGSMRIASTLGLGLDPDPRELGVANL